MLGDDDEPPLYMGMAVVEEEGEEEGMGVDELRR
jgi:hypothetical protein